MSLEVAPSLRRLSRGLTEREARWALFWGQAAASSPLGTAHLLTTQGQLGSPAPLPYPSPPSPLFPSSLYFQATCGWGLALVDLGGSWCLGAGAPGIRWPVGQVAQTGDRPGPQLVLGPFCASHIPGLRGQPP